MRCNFDDVEMCRANDRRNVVIYSLGNFVCAKTKLHKKNALIVTLCKKDFICIDYSF